MDPIPISQPLQINQETPTKYNIETPKKEEEETITIMGYADDLIVLIKQKKTENFNPKRERQNTYPQPQT